MLPLYGGRSLSIDGDDLKDRGMELSCIPIVTDRSTTPSVIRDIHVILIPWYRSEKSRLESPLYIDSERGKRTKEKTQVHSLLGSTLC